MSITKDSEYRPVQRFNKQIQQQKGPGIATQCPKCLKKRSSSKRLTSPNDIGPDSQQKTQSDDFDHYQFLQHFNQKPKAQLSEERILNKTKGKKHSFFAIGFGSEQQLGSRQTQKDKQNFRNKNLVDSDGCSRKSGDKLMKENRKLSRQNESLVRENKLFHDYFEEFQGRFAEQKRLIEKLTRRNAKLSRKSMVTSCTQRKTGKATDTNTVESQSQISRRQSKHRNHEKSTSLPSKSFYFSSKGSSC